MSGLTIHAKLDTFANLTWSASTSLNIFLLLSSFVSLIYNVSGAGTQLGPCTYQFDDGGIVDLSSVGFDNNTARWSDVTSLDFNFLYSYNPCYAFSIDGTDCQDAASCQQTVDGLNTFNIGSASSATFEEVDDLLFLKYTSGVRETHVQLACDQDVADSLVVTGETIINIYEMVLLSKCCCPDSCVSSAASTVTAATIPQVTTTQSPSIVTIITHRPATTLPPSSSKKLSAGSVLCILFVCLVAAYLICGVIYMKVFVGASGKELIPNVAFWEDLPNLITDGFVFLFSPCQKGVGKGAYEDL